MRVIVEVAPGYSNVETIEARLHFIHSGDVIVTGYDGVIAEIARAKHCFTEIHESTNWLPRERADHLMLDAGASMVVLFWDGKPGRMQRLLQEARARHLRVDVWMPNGNFISFKDGEMRDSTAMQMARR